MAAGNVLWHPSSEEIDSVTHLNLTEWTHVVATAHQSLGSHIYFDADLIASGAVSSPVDLTGAGIFLIGSKGNTVSQQRHFVGRIAQVALYSAALTQTQISSHYNAGVTSGTSGGTEGDVLTSDGADGATWAAPTLEVDY